MDNLSAADIDCDVVDFAIFRIKYQIARLCFRKADLLAALCLASGMMRQAHTIFLHNAQDKARAVRTLCQARTAPDVRVSKKLLRVVDEIDPDVRNTLTVFQLCQADRFFQLLCDIHTICGNIRCFIIQHDLNPIVLNVHNLKLFSLRYQCNDRRIQTSLFPHA